MNDEGVDLNDLPGVQIDNIAPSFVFGVKTRPSVNSIRVHSSARSEHVNSDRFCYSQDA